jgi:hypothetical protein
MPRPSWRVFVCAELCKSSILKQRKNPAAIEGSSFRPGGVGHHILIVLRSAAWSRAAILVFAVETYQQATGGAPTGPLFGLDPRDSSCLTCGFRQQITGG